MQVLPQDIIMQRDLKHSLIIVNCKHIFLFHSADITDNECGHFNASSDANGKTCYEEKF